LSKDVEDKRSEAGPDYIYVPTAEKEKRLNPPTPRDRPFEGIFEGDVEYAKRALKSYQDRTRPDSESAMMKALGGMGIKARRSDRPWENIETDIKKDRTISVGRRRRY
jgi:hypothetical protein